MEILSFLSELIEKYGYIIVGLAIMIESMGVPMPGETALVIAAAYAGAGRLNIALVIICAAAGAIIGDAGGYWIGRRFGRPFVEKYGKWLHLTPARMKKLETLFHRHGAMTVFFGRFFSLLRTYAALFAGIWHMSYKKFLLYNAMGGIVWALCFGMLGYLFGQNLALLESIARKVGWALSIPVVLIIAFTILWRWLSRNQNKVITGFKTWLSTSLLTRVTTKYSFQIHWVLRHWTAGQYTILHITTGLFIAIAGLITFVRLAHSSFTNATLALWDQTTLVFLQEAATPFASKIFTIVTSLGSYGVVACSLGFFLLFLIRKKWLKAWALAITVLGGQILVYVLKISYGRSSPDPTNIYAISGFGFSFPSAHAMESFIVYGALAYFLLLDITRWNTKTAVILTTLFLVLTISFSRLYLGENYLSDVLCGLAGGIVWLSTCLTSVELLRRGQVGDRRRKKRQPKIVTPSETPNIA